MLYSLQTLFIIVSDYQKTYGRSFTITKNTIMVLRPSIEEHRPVAWNGVIEFLSTIYLRSLNEI